MIEVIDHQADKRALDGIIALQLHKGYVMTVEFKDIQLKKLPAGKILSPEETPIPPGAKKGCGRHGRSRYTDRQIELSGPERLHGSELTRRSSKRMTNGGSVGSRKYQASIPRAGRERSCWKTSRTRSRRHWK